MKTAIIAISAVLIVSAAAFAGGVDVRPGGAVDNIPFPTQSFPPMQTMVPPPLGPEPIESQCKWHDEYTEVWDNSTVPPRLRREKTTVCDR